MAQDLLTGIRSFVAVAQHRGFAPAARQLNLPTSSISRHIQILEASLSKILLQRTTRRVTLTEAGNAYLPYAQHILVTLSQAQDTLSNLTTEPHGILKIGVCGALDTPVFAKHLQDFLLRYPKVSLALENDISPLSILEQKLDIVISEVNLHEKQLIKQPLFVIHRKVYAAPSYLKKYGTPKTIADLAHHNCLIFSRMSPDHCWKLGKRKIAVTGNYSANSTTAFMQALHQELGLGWCPETLVEPAVKAGTLCEVILETPPTTMQVYLYYRPTTEMHLKLAIQHLQKYTAH